MPLGFLLDGVRCFGNNLAAHPQMDHLSAPSIRFHASSSNLPKPQQLQTHQQTDTEAAAPAHQDELATMQTEILNNHPSGLTEEQPDVCKSLIPVSQPRNSIDDKQALKQTLSLPLSQVPIDYTNEF